jgi:hypothetical protein
VHETLDPHDAAPDNAILRAAASIVTDVLAKQGHALAAPVRARFRTSPHGSTGVELTVELDDPSRVKTVIAAIAEHFGGEAAVDVIRVT